MTEQLFQIGIKALIQNDEHQILLLKSKDKSDVDRLPCAVIGRSNSSFM